MQQKKLSIRRSTPMDYYIGIDNSSLDHKVRIIDDTGKQKFSSTIRNLDCTPKTGMTKQQL
jgi:hypothetical protein